MNEIDSRFEALGTKIDARLESDGYLDLVRKAFRTWDKADTDEKRRHTGNLTTNSAGTKLCSDDVVRLFIDWLSLYHEAHFAVVREIYINLDVSRFEIWSELYGVTPREDSAEAYLYKLLILDLSTGGVIRQARETTHQGDFKKRTPQRKRSRSGTMESAFEGSKPYVLTELGKQFVHYTMNKVVQRLEGDDA